MIKQPLPENIEPNFTISLSFQTIGLSGNDLVLVAPGPEPFHMVFLFSGPYSHRAIYKIKQGFKPLPFLLQDSLRESIYKSYLELISKETIRDEQPGLWCVRVTLNMLRTYLAIHSEPDWPTAAQTTVANIRLFNNGPQNDAEAQILFEDINQHLIQMINSVLENVDDANLDLSGATADINGVFWMDERAATYLESLPIPDTNPELTKSIQDFANLLRIKSRERLQTYRDSPSLEKAHNLCRFWLIKSDQDPCEPFICRTAEILWELRRTILKRQQFAPVPALTSTVARLVSQACGWNASSILQNTSNALLVLDSQTRPPQILATASTYQTDQTDSQTPSLPLIETNPGRHLFAQPEMLCKAYPALATRAGQELIQWVMFEIHKQTIEGRRESPRDITIDGGLDMLCERIGLSKGRDSTTITDALAAGNAFHLYIPGELVQLGLWNASIKVAKGGKISKIKIEASSFLAPYYSRTERLVPIIPTPTLIGRRNDYAAQMAFKFELVLAMVNAGSDLLNGGVLLPPKELELIAESARLPITTMQKALDCWTQDGSEAPKMLDLSGDRYLLSNTPPYSAARAFILDGATRVKKGREHGRKSAEAARNRRKPPK